MSGFHSSRLATHEDTVLVGTKEAELGGTSRRETYRFRYLPTSFAWNRCSRSSVQWAVGKFPIGYSWRSGDSRRSPLDVNPMAQRKKKPAPRKRSKESRKDALRRISLRAIPNVARLTERSAPFLSVVRAPRETRGVSAMGEVVSVATYNVHRWMGVSGRSAPDPARAHTVISELDVDVVALQEVLWMKEGDGPLGSICDRLGLHFAFAVTRMHKRGQLGNAILSRFPISAASVIDISNSRIERRGALTAQVGDGLGRTFGAVSTHLSLVDRTRKRQVTSLLDHPLFEAGPSVLLGDMNAWRRCEATRALREELEVHHNRDWPASFPSGRPVLALDRVYAHNAKVLEVHVHDTANARRASDHLPVVAYVELAPSPGP